MKILILNGPTESGKGTVVKYLKELLNLEIVQYSSIDYVKEVAKEKFGWDGEKDIKGRNLLASIKQTMIKYNDMPTKRVATKMTEAIVFDIDMMVVDIREPDEIEKLVEHCKKVNVPCVTCRVHNINAEQEANTNGLSLTGDRMYGEYTYDNHIYNNCTLEDLKREVIAVFGVISPWEGK